MAATFTSDSEPTVSSRLHSAKPGKEIATLCIQRSDQFLGVRTAAKEMLIAGYGPRLLSPVEVADGTMAFDFEKLSGSPAKRISKKKLESDHFLLLFTLARALAGAFLFNLI